LTLQHYSPSWALWLNNLYLFLKETIFHYLKYDRPNSWSGLITDMFKFPKSNSTMFLWNIFPIEGKKTHIIVSDAPNFIMFNMRWLIQMFLFISNSTFDQPLFDYLGIHRFKFNFLSFSTTIHIIFKVNFVIKTLLINYKVRVLKHYLKVGPLLMLSKETAMNSIAGTYWYYSTFWCPTIEGHIYNFTPILYI